jgi:adenosylcobinamide-phosphate guanylyltransferase
VDALVICGGEGSRLGGEVEKPLVEVGGRAMVDRVLDALSASSVERTYAVVSPNAPATRDHVGNRVPTVETPGEGYVSDLGVALEHVSGAVLTVAADLPLLEPETIDRVLGAHDDGSLAVYVPVERKHALGVSVDCSFEVDGREVAPTGLNVVGDGEDRSLVVDDDRLAVNVNRPADLQVAERLVER